MFIALSVFWFIRTIKSVFFWLYLWQIKEYHIGRFLDHFKTQKGQELILNPLQDLKLLLAIFFLLNNIVFSWVLVLLYFFESFIFFRTILDRKFKRPKFTLKTSFLTFFSVLLILLFPVTIYIYQQSIIQFSLYLLAFDLLAPFIVTAVIFLFQPLSVLIRNYIIRKAKNKITNFRRINNDLIVIAITGSYGKTSTKEFLSAILSYKFRVLKTRDHQNSEIGISRCILDNLNINHQIFIVEMGSYDKGGIKLLSDITGPKIGIVTGVNEQHLALFRSLDNLLSAEGGRELVDSLPKDGLLVLNGDNKYCLDLYKKTDINKKIYTLSNDKINSDIWADEITVKRDQISFAVLTKQKEVTSFNIDVLGKQNIQNILATILVARHLGMSFDEIFAASKNIKQEQGGMLLKDGKYGLSIINSSYSANPSGVIADIEYLDIFPKKKIIIMPCLIELGEKSVEIHEKIGVQIGKTCDFAIVTTKEMFETIKEGALKSGMNPKNIIFCENPDKILTKLSILCTEGDAVLLEGRVPAKVISGLLYK